MRKKQIKSISWLDTGIFPDFIMFAHGFEYDELVPALKRKKHSDGWLTGIQEDKKLIDSGNYFALKRSFTKDKKDFTNFYIIIKDSFTFTDYEFCKLAHEVLHICQFMLPSFLSRDREFECEAYLHTHIMKQCLKRLRQDGSKR